MRNANGMLGLIFSFSIISCDSGSEPGVVNGNYGKMNNLLEENENASHNENAQWPASFGFGRKAKESEIKAWDIDVSPDGKGLPPGDGTVTAGRSIYEIKCMTCHGKNGVGGSSGRLVGTMSDTVKAKTIGNYWPYATTLFDYIRRAMPYNAPGSLTDHEVYSLSAYLLYLNKIIDSTKIMNKSTLPSVKMPAEPYFVNDDRQGGPVVR